MDSIKQIIKAMQNINVVLIQVILISIISAPLYADAPRFSIHMENLPGGAKSCYLVDSVGAKCLVKDSCIWDFGDNYFVDAQMDKRVSHNWNCAGDYVVGVRKSLRPLLYDIKYTWIAIDTISLPSTGISPSITTNASYRNIAMCVVSKEQFGIVSFDVNVYNGGFPGNVVYLDFGDGTQTFVKQSRMTHKYLTNGDYRVNLIIYPEGREELAYSYADIVQIDNARNLDIKCDSTVNTVTNAFVVKSSSSADNNILGFKSDRCGTVVIHLVDPSGRVLHRSEEYCVSGSNSIEIPAIHTASGIYMVIMYDRTGQRVAAISYLE